MAISKKRSHLISRPWDKQKGDSILHHTADIDTTSTEPAALLADFLSGKGREATFSAFVSHYGGLFYNSALRRTGDPQLVEAVNRIDAQAATTWAMQIQNESLDRKSVAAATGRWRKNEPEAAGQWLNENGLE